MSKQCTECTAFFVDADLVQLKRKRYCRHCLGKLVEQVAALREYMPQGYEVVANSVAFHECIAGVDWLELPIQLIAKENDDDRATT